MEPGISPRPPRRLIVLAWLFALAGTALSYGQSGARDDDPHATGYIPPTADQEQRIRETHPRIVKVWPNQLALTRVNEERKKKGLGPLPEKGIVPRGAEKAFTVGEGPVISAVPQGFVGLEEQAGYVDNSLLDAFPEIRTQGSIGSCCAFAITYYQLTYTAGRLYGWNNKNTSNDRKFSPKWTYNMINEGEDHGSNQIEAYGVLEHHGAARWSLFPYQTNGADPKSYREWCRDGETWRDAIGSRIYPFFRWLPANRPPSSSEFDPWLAQIKTLLANGEVLTFPTYISNWQFTSTTDDRSTPDDNLFVRKPVAYWVNGTTGGHVMTIVGYNDSIWTDINKNRKVDPGERGALRIANSWGPNWQDSGFCWLAYDALRGQSIVDGGPSAGRQPAIMGYAVWSINIMANYAPALLAKFRLQHARRDQLCLALRASNGVTWIPGALQFQGGPYAFDGTAVPCEGTFVFDLTDILADARGSGACELWVADDDDPSNPDSWGSPDAYPAELVGYKLIDMTDATASGGLLDASVSIDASEYVCSLPYPSFAEHAPVAAASASPTSGRVPLNVSFDGRGSLDEGQDISSYVWDFGDGSPAGQGPVVQHTYSTAGTYTARLTVLDDNWTESSSQIVVSAARKR